MVTDMMHRVLADLEKSIISFGEHTFFDKGPEETFPLSDYSDELKLHNPKDVGIFLNDLNNLNLAPGTVKSIHCKMIASSLLESFDDKPQDWFDAVCDAAEM